MFGLIKFTLFVFVAALTGLLAVTVPFGGKTVADRAQAWWRKPAIQRAVGVAGERVKRGVEAAAQAPKEVHDALSKAEMDRLVTRRGARGQ